MLRSPQRKLRRIAKSHSTNVSVTSIILPFLYLAYPAGKIRKHASHVRTVSSSLPAHRWTQGPNHVLSAFVDATACPDAPKYAGVAAVLFDEQGLSEFERGLAEIKAKFAARGLTFGTFHATHCCGSRGHDQFKMWPSDARHDLCREMASLTGRTPLAGFVTLAQQTDFDELKAADSKLAHTIGDALYPATVFYTVDQIAAYAKIIDERVFYWIEGGDEKQQNLEAVLIKIRDDDRLRERFRFENFSIIPKDHDDGGPIAAADHVAWECKRNYWKLHEFVKNDLTHDDNCLTDNFKLLRGHRSGSWFETHLSKRALEVQSLIRMIYGLRTPGQPSSKKRPRPAKCD
jgi:hypothetical protein